MAVFHIIEHSIPKEAQGLELFQNLMHKLVPTSILSFTLAHPVRWLQDGMVQLKCVLGLRCPNVS